MRQFTIPVFAAAAVLAIAAPVASAHVSAQPPEQPSGGFTVVTIRVPNERPEATNKVEVQFPDGVTSVRYEPVAGWSVDVKMEELDTPIDDGHGGKLTEQVDTVTFSGGAIEEGQFRDFPLSFRMVEGDVGEAVYFPAIQTYEGGEEVAWTEQPSADGDAELERPAPSVTLVAGSDDHHASGGGDEAKDDAHEEDDAGNDAADDDLQGEVDAARMLGIAGIIVGALGLLLGVVGLRRRS